MHKQEQTEKEISLTFSLDRIIWIIHFINVLCVSTVYDRGVCVWLIKRVLCVCVVPDSWLVPASEPAANRLASVSSCGQSSLQQSFYLSNVFQNGHNCFVAGGSWELGGGETHLHVAPEFRFFILTSKRKHKHSISSYRPSHPYFFSQILNLTSTFLDCLTL